MRIVNHQKHNSDFFYALLVVAENRAFHRKRYAVKHFLFKRGDAVFHEIPSSEVRSIKAPAVYLGRINASEEISKEETKSTSLTVNQSTGNAARVRDKDVIPELYPAIKPFFSKQAESLYWRGKLNLIDDTTADIIVLESTNRSKLSYSISLSASSREFFQCNQLYLKRSFESARKAIHSLEHDLNREIFNRLKQTSVDSGR